MPSRLQTIVRVLPNPYHSLDHEGRPAGHCPRERLMSTAPGTHQGYVGCTCLATAPEKLPDGHHGTPNQDTVWHFSREPLSIADPRGYYRLAVSRGEIIAADQKTAMASNVKYVPYDEALRLAKAEAVAKWRAAFGEDPPEVDPFTKPTPGVFPGDPVPVAAPSAEVALEMGALEAPAKSSKKEGR